MADKEIFLRDLKSVTFIGRDNLDKDLKYKEDNSPTGNIKNWLRYRICSKAVWGECDIDKRVFNMYERLFERKEPQEGDKKRLFRLKNESIILETDTMNSFATIFNSFMRFFYNENYRFNFENNKGSSSNSDDNKIIDRDRYFLNNIDIWYYNFSPSIKAYFDIFNTFAAYTHCLANMILVPKGYNSGRYRRTKDFWDLSLMDIYEKHSKEKILYGSEDICEY